MVSLPSIGFRSPPKRYVSNEEDQRLHWFLYSVLLFHEMHFVITAEPIPRIAVYHISQRTPDFKLGGPHAVLSFILDMCIVRRILGLILLSLCLTARDFVQGLISQTLLKFFPKSLLKLPIPVLVGTDKAYGIANTFRNGIILLLDDLKIFCVGQGGAASPAILVIRSFSLRGANISRP